MGKFTKEEVNKIINLQAVNGKLIDIFDLHGVLYVGNSQNGTWDLTETYQKFSEHSLPINIEDFEQCETEKDVQNTFVGLLEKAVSDQLV